MTSKRVLNTSRANVTPIQLTHYKSHVNIQLYATDMDSEHLRVSLTNDISPSF
jgi:hypothetical protein